MQQQPEAAGTASTLVRFWGVRGSIPTPGPATVQVGGNTSCVEVRVGTRILILDAGTGLRLLGLHLLNEFGFRPLDLTLLLTHTHWDHIQGLPFFSPLYHDRNSLHILGLQGSRHSMERVLNSQMEIPFFPIGLRQVPGNIHIEELTSPGITLDNIHITTCKANHPGHCVGYKIRTPHGTIAFFPDHETIPEAPGSDAVSAFLHGVDLLIMDSQYDEAQYENHRGWGHGCVNAVVTQALQAQVRRLVLFHHDPCSDDAAVARMEELARAQVRASGGTLEVMAAREGLELALP